MADTAATRQAVPSRKTATPPQSVAAYTMEAPPSGRWFVWLAFAAFVAVGIINVTHHEMWRDELQSWAIAHGSHSLSELAANWKYEPHPRLWYLTLYALTAITENPQAMPWVHFAFSAAAAFLLLRFAPLPWWQRLLTVFGYYLLFEYGTISRNYIQGILLLFAVCALYPQRQTRPILMATLLALLCQTSAYGLFLASAIAAVLLAQRLWRKEGTAPAATTKSQILSLGIFLLGVTICLASLAMPEDEQELYGSWGSCFDPGRLVRVLSIPWTGLVPIPMFRHEFWCTNILLDYPVAAMMASLAVLAVALLILSRGWWGLLMFILVAMVMMASSYFRAFGSVRHHGHIFLALLAGVWINRCRARGDPGQESGDRSALNLTRQIMLGMILGIGTAVGIASSVMDWAFPFSDSADATNYIRANFPADTFIVAHEDYAGTSVAARLDRPMWFLRGGREGIFVMFDQQRDNVAQTRTQQQLHAHARALLLSNSPATQPQGYTLAASFTCGVVPSEHYWIWILQPPGDRGGMP